LLDCKQAKDIYLLTIRRIRLHYFLALVLINIGLLTFIAFKAWQGATAKAADASVQSETAVVHAKSGKTYRLAGYNLVKPYLFSEPAESADLAPLKAEVLNIISERQQSGIITSASVYLRTFSPGSLMTCNTEDLYHPGSLAKLPLMITFLRQADANPSLLDQQIPFEKPEKDVPGQTYNSLQIHPGQRYTIRDLLRFMISYSDNNATSVLNKFVNPDMFVKTFTDLGINAPDIHDRNYVISNRDYSKFLLVLYNASYVSKNNSEMAIKLLSECDFKEGIVKDIPSNIVVAHKFGEWGDKGQNIHELHESALFYLKDKTYLLTVMTRGAYNADVKDLSQVISSISTKVYQQMSAASGT
jgi:beta-lactamase class A